MPECKDCFNGCGPIQFDKCISYTGEDVDELSICNMDKYDKVTKVIIDKLLSFSDGTSIFPDVTLTTASKCFYVGNKFPSTTNSLKIILDTYATMFCELKIGLTDLTTAVNSPYAFNTSCLTIGANPSKDDVLQANINKTCALSAQVTTILGDYVKASQLNTLIQQYIDSTVVVSTVQYSTKMVPFVAYEYYGPLTNFNAAGVGLTAAGFTKVYLCNGDNGTPDKRGRVTVGANVGVPGGAMDAAVNPATAGNYQISLKTKLGEYRHLLTLGESPAHTHTATAADHYHYVFANVKTESGPVTSSQYTIRESGDANSAYSIKGTANILPSVGKTSTANIPISVGTSGGGQLHNITQPSIGAYFIMYIP